MLHTISCHVNCVAARQYQDHLNRLWCCLTIPILWENPFSINYNVIDIYLHYLNDKIFIENEVNLHTLEIEISITYYVDYILEIILQYPIFIHQIRNLKGIKIYKLKLVRFLGFSVSRSFSPSGSAIKVQLLFTLHILVLSVLQLIKHLSP
ncbi:unnamed protein product [Rhizophagus irregularis]|nr:unnamed protein product [Rhizophagus irregularis]